MSSRGMSLDISFLVSIFITPFSNSEKIHSHYSFIFRGISVALLSRFPVPLHTIQDERATSQRSQLQGSALARRVDVDFAIFLDGRVTWAGTHRHHHHDQQRHHSISSYKVCGEWQGEGPTS